jgi:hypothetical protein
MLFQKFCGSQPHIEGYKITKMRYLKYKINKNEVFLVKSTETAKCFRRIYNNKVINGLNY